ncbi:MAG: hypothetical protein ACX931_08845 [Saccharospirillum sp.]
MKAIKIASGVAVSALAAAISAQSFAAAHEGGAETSATVSGDLKVNTVVDLENETRETSMPGFASPDEDWFNLSVETAIVHGPFSGDIVVGLQNGQEDEADDAGARADDGYGRVFVDNLRVDEGPVSFGDIGRITDTAGLYEGLADQSTFIDEDESTRFGVAAAFRYSVEDLGLRVQAEGNGGDFGLAAAIKQDLDVATFWADFQFREAVGNDGMDDAETAFGVGAQATPVDMLTLTAVYRNKSDRTLGDWNSAAGATVDEGAFAVHAEAMLTETISVYGMLVDPFMDTDDTTVMKFGGSVGIDAITLSASYEALTHEAETYLITGKVAYAQDAISAFAEVAMSAEDFSGSDGGSSFNTSTDAGTEFVLGADYTTASGIVYGGEYTNTGEDFWDAGGNTTSEIELFAQYSF